MSSAQTRGLNPWLVAAGVALLLYAVAGNYVALPGYIRFLERGGTSATGDELDLSVVLGAARTIAWMYSFQIGVLAIALARSLRDGLHTRYLAGGIMVWIVVWSWPSLPAPGPWFYLVFGTAILCAIVLVVLQLRPSRDTRLSRTLTLAAVVFFAYATWEVCGLGSTGRILHPEQSGLPMAHNLVVTQSSKLMFEFLFAWLLLLAGAALGRTPAPAIRTEEEHPPLDLPQVR